MPGMRKNLEGLKKGQNQLILEKLQEKYINLTKDALNSNGSGKNEKQCIYRL